MPALVSPRGSLIFSALLRGGRPAALPRHCTVVANLYSTKGNAAIQTPPSPPETKKPYYVTTPIYYVNAAPHIGHLFSSVLADTLARYAKLKDPNRDVSFCTGTDEHGLKIQRAAEAKGKTPRELCDETAKTFQALADASSIGYTRFIRTTEPVHYEAVAHLWKELKQRGYIYKGRHSGWYSVSDEAFYPESQVSEATVDGQKCKIATESGSVVEWMEEENYKFKLSAFRERLISWLEQNPRAIVPEDKWKEVYSTLADHRISETGEKEYLNPLEDLSVSRPGSRLTWGIPVPDDPEHTIYVWIDALTNYITAVGYPWLESAEGSLRKPWPADVQVIGKDIVRFHAIYWPAMLMALDIPPPKTLLVHAHWTMDRFKMSKSRGNVANPFEVMEQFGKDAVRYYLMRNAAITNNSDWSEQQVTKHYKRDLASMLGNLRNRRTAEEVVEVCKIGYLACLKTTSVNIEGAEYSVPPEAAAIHELLTGAKSGKTIVDVYEEKMDSLEINKAVAAVMELASEANTLFSNIAPWTRTADDCDLVQLAHFYTYLSLQIVGILLQPVMPEKAKELLDTMDVYSDARSFDFVRGVLKGEEFAIEDPLTDRFKGPLFPKLPTSAPTRKT